MTGYLISRIIQALLTIFFVFLIVFIIIRIPGDPAAVLLGQAEGADLRLYEELRERLRLDDPLYVQFGSYLGQVVRGDMGDSWSQRRPAMEIILERFPRTIELAAAAMLIAVAIGVPLGILAAVKRNTIYDRGVKSIALVGQSLPTFWVAILLVVFVAGTFGNLPAGGRGSIKHLILPAISLSTFTMAALARLVRSAMLDVLQSDYITMARIKGVAEFTVITKHALKNAAIPVVTLMGLQLTALLTGAVVTEVVFAYPGVGLAIFNAINGRDFPVIQAAVIFTATLFVLANLLVDLLYLVLDPRVRYVES